VAVIEFSSLPRTMNFISLEVQLSLFRKVRVISCNQKTCGLLTKARDTVKTLVVIACAVSMVKVVPLKLIPCDSVTRRPELLSVTDIRRGPHFESPSLFPQTLLTVSGSFSNEFNSMVFTPSVLLNEIYVVCKAGAGVTVKCLGSNEDAAQSQSASAPNPQNLKS
jgi:hypothetical protein